jgi:hypothetical protein
VSTWTIGPNAIGAAPVMPPTKVKTTRAQNSRANRSKAVFTAPINRQRASAFFPPIRSPSTPIAGLPITASPSEKLTTIVPAACE